MCSIDWSSVSVVIATLLGPILAVWAADIRAARKAKTDQKMRLFHTLYANRKANPLPYSVMQAMNSIDLVFHDTPEVLAAWHAYYSSTTPVLSDEAVRHSWLNLLSALAKHLDYPNLSQTDADKFYFAQTNADLFRLDLDLKMRLLDALQGKGALSVKPQTDE